MNPSSDGAYHRDWEKDLAGGQPPFDSHHNLPQATEHATTIFTAFSEDVEEDEDGGEEDEEAEEDGPKKHAMWILVRIIIIYTAPLLYKILRKSGEREGAERRADSINHYPTDPSLCFFASRLPHHQPLRHPCHPPRPSRLTILSLYNQERHHCESPTLPSPAFETPAQTRLRIS